MSLQRYVVRVSEVLAERESQKHILYMRSSPEVLALKSQQVCSDGSFEVAHVDVFSNEAHIRKVCNQGK